MQIEMNPVSSSNIQSVGYDDDTRTLRITFNNGATYEYTGVPSETYRALMRADSKGSYFAKEIKGKYAVTKLEPEAA